MDSLVKCYVQCMVVSTFFNGLACCCPPALQAVPAGQVLLRVPLHLALTDHADDKEGHELTYEGAPWSVRLAAKLLKERAKGSDSPWAPYLQVGGTRACRAAVVLPLSCPASG